MKLSGLGCVIGAVALWSTNALAAKIALAELTALQVLALQFLGATVALVLMQRLVRRQSNPFKPPSIGSVVIGVTGLVGTISFQYLAFSFAPIIEANILTYSWPLFVVLWVALLQRTPQEIWFVALAIIGFSGVTLIIGGDTSLTYSLEHSTGYVLALASSICMAFYTLAAGRSRRPTLDMLLPAAVIGMVIMLILTAADGAPWPSIGYLLIGLYIGIGPMAVGYYLWTRAMAQGEPRRLVLLGYTTTVFSTAWLLAAGESFTVFSLIGATLILGTGAGALIYYQDERRLTGLVRHIVRWRAGVHIRSAIRSVTQ